MALVAVINEDTPQARIHGVARYVSNPDKQSCEFARPGVADAQATKRHRTPTDATPDDCRQDRGIEIMEGEVPSHNSKMLRLKRRTRFPHGTQQGRTRWVAVRRHS